MHSLGSLKAYVGEVATRVECWEGDSSFSGDTFSSLYSSQSGSTTTQESLWSSTQSQCNRRSDPHTIAKSADDGSLGAGALAGTGEGIEGRSKGSHLHATGECTPCKFFRSRRGCRLAEECKLCHFPHAEMTGSSVRRAVRKKAIEEHHRLKGDGADPAEVAGAPIAPPAQLVEGSANTVALEAPKAVDDAHPGLPTHPPPPPPPAVGSAAAGGSQKTDAATHRWPMQSAAEPAVVSLTSLAGTYAELGYPPAHHASPRLSQLVPQAPPPGAARALLRGQGKSRLEQQQVLSGQPPPPPMGHTLPIESPPPIGKPPGLEVQAPLGRAACNPWRIIMPPHGAGFNG